MRVCVCVWSWHKFSDFTCALVWLGSLFVFEFSIYCRNLFHIYLFLSLNSGGVLLGRHDFDVSIIHHMKYIVLFDFYLLNMRLSPLQFLHFLFLFMTLTIFLFTHIHQIRLLFMGLWCCCLLFFCSQWNTIFFTGVELIRKLRFAFFSLSFSLLIHSHTLKTRINQFLFR